MLDFYGPGPGGFIIFSSIIFIIVIGVFAFVIFRGLFTWMSNNAAEVISTYCRVVGKRTQVWGGANNTSANTSYFITFELDDGKRMELAVRAKQYGLIVEGDEGTLTYQGTRFKGFERDVEYRDQGY